MLVIVQLDLSQDAEIKDAALGLRDLEVLLHLEQDLPSLHELAFETQLQPYVIDGPHAFSRQYY